MNDGEEQRGIELYTEEIEVTVIRVVLLVLQCFLPLLGARLEDAPAVATHDVGR